MGVSCQPAPGQPLQTLTGGSPTSRACPTCRHEPTTRAEAAHQRADLAVTWLHLDPARPGTLISHNGLAQRFDGQHDGAFRAVLAEHRVNGPVIVTHTLVSLSRSTDFKDIAEAHTDIVTTPWQCPERAPPP